MLDAAQESVDVRLLTNCLQGAKWFWWDLARTSHSDEARFQSNIASQNHLCTFASMSINFCDDGVYNANLQGKRCSSDLYLIIILSWQMFIISLCTRSLVDGVKQVQLELGGKDPAYVRKDVPNVAAAALSIADGAFYNCGQVLFISKFQLFDLVFLLSNLHVCWFSARSEHY